MESLPLLIDAEEAEHFYKSHPDNTDAAKAYAIGVMSNDGYSNTEIREALEIDKVYTVTHFKRAGTLLSIDELDLWHKNPGRITLGHVRAIAKLKREKREALLRDLLSKKHSVAEYEAIGRGQEKSKDADIKRFEQLMSEALGRDIKIQYNKAKQYGRITLGFFTLNDLDEIAEKLGFLPEEI